MPSRFRSKTRSITIEKNVEPSIKPSANTKQCATKPSTKPIDFIKIDPTQKAEIDELLQRSSATGHVVAIKERRLSKPIDANSNHVPRPDLTRMSSETREINELIKMISGKDVEDGKKLLQERRKSQASAGSETIVALTDLPAPSPEVEEINLRIRQDKDRRASRQEKVTAVTKEQGKEPDHAASFERRLAMRLAFERSRGRHASYVDGATAPYVGLKRSSSGCGSPAFKRSSSSATILVGPPCE